MDSTSSYHPVTRPSPTGGESSRRRFAAFCVLLSFLFFALASNVGCASYTEQIRESRTAVSQSDAKRAVHELNRHLDVEDFDEQPKDLDNENALLLLERASALQALGYYEEAARDMMAIDDRLEWLDIDSDTADNILQWVYSDDTGPYRAPPHERLLLNTQNMINFMAAGQHNSARVEARRFDVLQRYHLDEGSAELIPELLGLGNYLAGAAFEADENYRDAARFYTLAYLYGIWPEADDHRLIDLIAVSGYSGGGLGEAQRQADPLLERASERPRLDRSQYRENYQTGDTLIVIQTGMVPYLQAERISLSDALRYSERSPYTALHFQADTAEQAMRLYTAGELNWLNTTRLTRDGPTARPSTLLAVGDRRLRLTNPIAIGDQVEAAWELIAATALAAGISRAVTRAVAGAATGAIVEGIAEAADIPGAGLLGFLTGAGLQASLAAADTPDTRSWTSLPDGVHLVRLQLDEGTHQVDVEIGNDDDFREIEVNSRGFHLVNFSRVR